MQDRPTAEELVEAVRAFSRTEILPELQGLRVGFCMPVATNALSALEQKLARKESFLLVEHDRLARLLGESPARPGSLEDYKERERELNRCLARPARRGEVFEGAFRSLKQIGVDEFEVVSPRSLKQPTSIKAAYPTRQYEPCQVLPVRERDIIPSERKES